MCVRDDAGLEAALADERLPLPCVVKPLSGAESAGVTVVSDPTAEQLARPRAVTLVAS